MTSRAVTCAAERRAVAKPGGRAGRAAAECAADGAAAGGRTEVRGGKRLARGELGVMSGTMYIDTPGEK
jgi:hypothetical protein